MSFAGLTAVVTGGSSGIGRAIALGRAGAHLVVGSLRAEAKSGDPGERADIPVVDMLRGEGASADFVPADVSRADDMDCPARTTTDSGRKLDICVNNAGIVTPPAPFWDCADGALERSRSVNTLGVWNGMRSAARAMIADGTRGPIVNILSAAAIRPHADQAPYDISKAAAAQATRCAALGPGPYGIRVNAVCPRVVRTALSASFVDTPQFRDWFADTATLGCPVETEQVADAVLFLASEGAAAITGIMMPVDSGEALGPPAHALPKRLK